jgi:uncharacterized protein (TIGR02246 family)
MKRIILLINIFAICAICLAQDMPSDEAAIKANFEKFAAAWNKQDAKTMASMYAADGSLITPGGKEGWGSDAVEKLLEEAVTVTLKGSKTSFEVHKIRFLKPDIAFVDATQIATGAISPDGKPMPEIKVHASGTLLKKDGNWWFLDIRVCQFIMPPPPEKDPSMK